MKSNFEDLTKIDSLELTRLAKGAGLLQIAEQAGPQLKEFALMIMEKCAAVGDRVVDDRYQETAGFYIRRRFGVV